MENRNNRWVCPRVYQSKGDRKNRDYWTHQLDLRIMTLSAVLLLSELESHQGKVGGKVNKKKRKRARFRVRPIFERRYEQGAYHNLVQEMRLQDSEMHFNYFRMDKQAFDLLLAKVGPSISKQYLIREPLSPGERLAATLRYLASGDSMRSISFSYRIGKSTVSEVIQETCLALWHTLKDDVIPLPTTDMWKQTADDFLNRWDLPHCIGAIDGKHIVMQAPPNSGSDYFNYKKSHSIVLLAVCNAQYQFTVADIGARGRQSDGGIFRHSTFGKCLLGNQLNLPAPEPVECGGEDIPYFLAADEAFPLHMNIMRPYPGSFLTAIKRIYNYRLSRARRIIENTFGILCSRWRIFRKPIIAGVMTIEAIVQATICLHNYLMQRQANTGHTVYCPKGFTDREDTNGTVIPGQWRTEDNEGNFEGNLANARQLGSNTYTRNASHVRDTLANFFMDEGSVPFQWDKI